MALTLKRDHFISLDMYCYGVDLAPGSEEEGPTFTGLTKSVTEEEQSLCMCLINFFAVLYRTRTRFDQIQGFVENLSTY